MRNRWVQEKRRENLRKESEAIEKKNSNRRKEKKKPAERQKRRIKELIVSFATDKKPLRHGRGDVTSEAVSLHWVWKWSFFAQKRKKGSISFGGLEKTHTFASAIAKIAQLVEHNLAKVRVAGSSPVFRSGPLEWWNGRHEGLKILWLLQLCGFKSRFEYTGKILKPCYPYRYRAFSFLFFLLYR